MASPTSRISIFVEPPSEDHCGPLDFGDGHAVVDPPFDTTGYAQYLEDNRGFSEMSGKDGFENMSVLGDRSDPALGRFHSPNGGGDRPYPFGSMAYNVLRSPAEDCSPYSSTLDDELSPTTSPSIHDGPLSPYSNIGDLPQAPLSPTLLSNLSMPFIELSLDSNRQPVSALRVRSNSAAERTVAPSDTWCDPSARPVRSAPSMIAPLPEDIFDYTPSGGVSDGDLFPHSGEIVSPASEGGFLSSGDEPSPDPGVAAPPAQIDHYDAGGGLLFRPEHGHPRPPHNPAIQYDHTTTRASHHRVYSDSSGFLSPTSPIYRRSDRIPHRRTASAPRSIRHEPYPASVPSTPERGPAPELVAGYGAPRRHSGPSSARPKLSIAVPVEHDKGQIQLYPTTGDDQAVGFSHVPYDVADPVKSEWNQASGPPLAVQLAHGAEQPMYTVDQPSPSSAVSNVSSPGHKNVVGSRKIVDASTARRKRDSKFECTWPNCHQTFTAKHNWKYHWLSHTGERPFACGKCKDTFTTPGVASRHRTKCHGESEGNSKRRRSRLSMSSSSNRGSE